MTIKTLARKGVPKRAIARQLDMTEGNVRYHLSRLDAGAVDGRSRQRHKAADLAGPIEFWLSDRQQCGAPINLAELHQYLVAEHDYDGSLRSIQRYVAAHYPPPRQRARRRVETLCQHPSQQHLIGFICNIQGAYGVKKCLIPMKLSPTRALRSAPDVALA